MTSAIPFLVLAIALIAGANIVLAQAYADVIRGEVPFDQRAAGGSRHARRNYPAYTG